MKTTNKLIAATALLGTLLATGTAQAAGETGAYLLAGGGISHFNNDCTGVAKCDNTGSSTKLLGGYRFGNGLAAEVVALDFGKATGVVSGVNVEVKGKATGVGVAVYGQFGSNWVGTARLGAANVKVTGTGSLGAVTISQSESTTSTYVGFGMAYHFTPMVSAELGLDAVSGKFSGETATLRALTLSLGVKF